MLGWSKSLLLAVLLMIGSTVAQVQTIGRFAPYGHSKSSPFDDVITTIPTQDNAALLKAALESEQSDPITHIRPAGPHKFAEAVDVYVDIAEPQHGRWITDTSNNRRTWRTVIRSAGALSISLLFSDFHLPDDAEFYVIGRDETLGAFTSAINNKSTRKFATTPLAGDSLIIEYHEPLHHSKSTNNASPDANSQSPPAIRVSKVVHGFRSTPFAYGDCGHCHIDAACKRSHKTNDPMNSTVVMITDNGTSFCSGTMINNARGDGAQYFLTANHCVFSDPSYFIVGFNYQQNTCFPSRQHYPPQPPKPQTVHGISLVTRWEGSDFALLKISERIPNEYNAFLAGWDANYRAPADVFSIHHPQGDLKKISLFSGQTQLTGWTPWERVKMHWRIPRWSEGSTERGSSGGGLFDSNGRLVGHLRGGTASCADRNGWDVFGALFADFNYPAEGARLKRFLDPDNTGVKVVNGAYLRDLRP